MKLSKATLIMLRRVALAFVSALDHALLEGYGWTAKGLTKRVE